METQSTDVRYSLLTFDVASIIRRINDKEIVIPRFTDEVSNEIEGFQRNFVWNKRQMDEFIESVLLKYPTPGIFFVEQEDDTFLVLDGQQRLLTLKYFMSGSFPTTDNKKKPFNLTAKSISEEFRNKSYHSLPPALRRRIDNYSFSITSIQTLGKKGNRIAIYEIFKRLNSAGTKLNPHEVRVATWAGRLVRELQNFNDNHESWRILYGKYNPDNRLKDHEFLSRILSVYLFRKDFQGSYPKLIDKFYNKYHNNDLSHTLSLLDNTFNLAVDVNKDLLRPAGVNNLAWGELITNMILASIEAGMDRDIIKEKCTELYEIFTDSPSGRRFEIDELSIEEFQESFNKHSSSTASFHSRYLIAERVFGL